MHPKYKRKAAKAKAKAAKSNPSVAATNDAKDMQARKFPGLSVPDQDWSSAENYVEDRSKKEPEEQLPMSITMDNTMAELAAVAARRNRPAAEDFLSDEPLAKRQKPGDGDQRYPSAHAREHGSRQRDGMRDNGYGDRSRDGGYDGRGRTRIAFDDRPVLYKIYDGVVQNIRDFGAFVSLEGIQGRAEGKSSCECLLTHRYGPRLKYHWLET